MRQAGIKPNALPIRSPNLNGRCERFIETIKLECLNKFIVFGKGHLDYLLKEFTDYYNHHRSHSAREHLPPVSEEPEEVVSLQLSEVDTKEHLGGLVTSFERKAA
jgi:putative transposase